MKSILVIGAGGHGQVVAEVAEACGYTRIDFLDDCSEAAIGKIQDMDKFQSQYKDAFVGIGNNILRKNLMNQLVELGYNIPVLIHPSSYVSKSASINKGTLIEPKAIVNTHSNIGSGSIISVGSIIDHDVSIGNFCHINSGSIVKAGASVDDLKKLEAGEVVLGYKSAIVNNG